MMKMRMIAMVLLLGSATGCGSDVMPEEIDCGDDEKCVSDESAVHRISLQATPEQAVADGVNAIAVEVTVLDAQDQPLSDISVLLTANGEGHSFSPSASGISDEDGLFTANMTSTEAGSKTITATVDDEFSEEVDVIFSEAPVELAAPQDLVVTEQNQGLTLSWSEVTGATGYNIYWAQESGVGPAGYAELEGGDMVEDVMPPFAIEGLQNDVTYFLVVTARTDDVEGPASNEVEGIPFAQTKAQQEWSTFIDGEVNSGGRHSVLPSGDIAMVIRPMWAPVVVGEGEPNETLLDDEAFPVLAWFSGEDGHLLDTFKLATYAADPGHGIFHTNHGYNLATDDEGYLYLGANVAGHLRIFPGADAEMEWIVPSGEYNGALSASYDMMLTRFDLDRTPAWTTRARTPTSIEKSWYNGIENVSVRRDGGLFWSGRFEKSGLIFGEGTPGTTTLEAPDETGNYPEYMAWLDADSGTLERVYTYSHSGTASKPVMVDDGTVFFTVRVLEEGWQLRVDESEQYFVEESGLILVSISPEGDVSWTRPIEGDAEEVAIALSRSEDSLLLTGECPLTLASNTTTSCENEDEIFVANFDTEGSLNWLHTFAVDTLPSAEIEIGANGDIWFLARFDITAGSIPLGDAGSLELPTLPEGVTGKINVAYRISPDGQDVSARVVGLNIYPRELQIDSDGTFSIQGKYYSTDLDRYIIDSNGQFIAVPEVNEDDSSSRHVYLAKFNF